MLTYRLPREPSAPRTTLWRKLRRLGVAQLSDGLVALPADARTREQLEWIADDVVAAGGTAGRLARPADDRRPGARARRGDGRRPGRRVPSSSPSSAGPRPDGRSGRAARGRCAGCARSGGRSAGATSSRRRSATRPPPALRELEPARIERGSRSDEVGDPRRRAHRPGGLRLADPPLHRPGRGVRVRRRPRRGAGRRDAVRHARRRAAATTAATAPSRRSCAATS